MVEDGVFQRQRGRSDRREHAGGQASRAARSAQRHHQPERRADLPRHPRGGRTPPCPRLSGWCGDAAGTKAPLAKTADKVSGIFVPTVICIALVTFAVWMLLGQTFPFALARAISVLVISCPCALGPGPPRWPSWWAAAWAPKTASCSRPPPAWRPPATPTPWCWTRPGTVTTGEPTVVKVVGTRNVPAKFLLGLAAGLEARSEHPLARAILKKGRRGRRQVPPGRRFPGGARQGLAGQGGRQGDGRRQRGLYLHPVRFA